MNPYNIHFSIFNERKFICDCFFFCLQIRTAGMVFYTLWYNIVAFLGDKYFPILLDIIELHGCLMIFAINCCIGTLFVVFYMKETKGRSLDFSDSTPNNSQ